MELVERLKLFYPPITNHDDTNITVTGTIPQSKGELMEGKLIVRIGTILPANDNTAQFVVNDTYDVTNGDAFGSLISMGRVLKQRLPVMPSAAAITSLASHGVFVEDADTTIRPNFGEVADLPPITAPVIVNDALNKKFTWTAVANARAYLVYANNRVVNTIFAGATPEHIYGDVHIDTSFNVKAIGDNLVYGNSVLSNTIKITAGGAL